MAAIRLDNACDGQLRTMEQRLSGDRLRLEGVSPMRVLERGYALVTDQNGRLVSSALQAPETMRLRFKDGQLSVRRQEDEHGCEENGDI